MKLWNHSQKMTSWYSEKTKSPSPSQTSFHPKALRSSLPARSTEPSWPPHHLDAPHRAASWGDAPRDPRALRRGWIHGGFFVERWIILKDVVKPFYVVVNPPILLDGGSTIQTSLNHFYYIILVKIILCLSGVLLEHHLRVFDLKMKSWSFLKVQHQVQNSRHLVEVEPFGWCLRVTINLYLQGSVPTPSHFPQVKGQPNARAGKTLHTADCLPRKRWWDHHTPWLIWKSGRGFPEKWSLGFLLNKTWFIRLHNWFKSFQLRWSHHLFDLRFEMSVRTQYSVSFVTHIISEMNFG